MSKMEKALAELDALMSEVDALRKEEETEEMMATEEVEMAESEEETVEAGSYEMMETESKAVVPTVDGAGIEIGEPADRVVISGGKPVAKAFDNNEFKTLTLDNATIEKAYEQYRQEQLEKLAYENLEKSFEARFQEEIANREAVIEKQNYDAQAEIATLKEEFSNLAKSLVAEKDAIIKAQEESVVTLPNIEEVAEMSWSDIHKMVGGI